MKNNSEKISENFLENNFSLQLELFSHSTEMGPTDGKWNRKKYCSEFVWFCYFLEVHILDKHFINNHSQISIHCDFMT